MNIVIVNGSPRKGNTVTAINALVEGLKSNDHAVEILNTYDYNVGPCKGCNVCECYKGCVAQDDTNPVVNKLAAADMVIWCSPVYWWGVTASFKLVLDKCYCRGAQIKNKKIGLVVVGGSPVDNMQYQLIDDQFACIEKYLGWERLFSLKYYASAKEDLAQDAAALEELRAAGASVK